MTFSIEAPTQANSFFGVFLSGDNYPGIPLPGMQRILPLKNDWILQATGLLPGLTGVLDHQGRANVSLAILNHPALNGLDLHCAMLTLTPAGNLGVVSNGVQLTIGQ